MKVNFLGVIICLIIINQANAAQMMGRGGVKPLVEVRGYLNIGADPYGFQPLKDREKLYILDQQVEVYCEGNKAIYHGFLPQGTMVVVRGADNRILRIFQCGNPVLNNLYVREEVVFSVPVSSQPLTRAAPPTQRLKRLMSWGVGFGGGFRALRVDPDPVYTPSQGNLGLGVGLGTTPGGVAGGLGPLVASPGGWVVGGGIGWSTPISDKISFGIGGGFWVNQEQVGPGIGVVLFWGPSNNQSSWGIGAAGGWTLKTRPSVKTL